MTHLSPVRAVAALALAATAIAPGIATARAVTMTMPTYQHIIYVMMENHTYDQIIGNAAAPRINKLARSYGIATSYYGVTHPSEPNYVASIGGSYFGIQDDKPYSATIKGVNHTLHAPSLVSQLEAKGLTWKSYQESMPSPGFLGTVYPSAKNVLYASKHNPFVNFAAIQSNPAELRKIVPFAQFGVDLKNGALPSFSYVVPNQCSDMHGGPAACPSSSKSLDANDEHLIALGDAWVDKLVTTVMVSSAWSSGNNAIVIVWDENDYSASGVTGCCGANPGGGRVAAIVVTNHGPRGLRDGVPYNHYSLLLTIEEAFGLGCLQHACDKASVKPMTPLFA